MLIELQEPFKSQWRNGYLRADDAGRKYLSLYNEPGVQTSISYARYLVTCKLGEFIPEGYEVDHVNDDKTDDRIENLQILTAEENVFKQHYRYYMHQQPHYLLCCAWCEVVELVTERIVKMKRAQGVQYYFCGKRCAAKFQHNGKAPELIPSYGS